MHYRRLVCFVLGVWLGCSLFMAYVATRNFRGVERLLAAPAWQARGQIAALGQDGARTLLRYQAGELNRAYFEAWEAAQLTLAALVLFMLLFATRENKYTLLLAALMLAIVLVQRFGLTPRIVELGRLLDFTLDPESAARARFRVLHGAYSGVEVAKWLLGLVLAVRIMRRHHHAPAAAEVPSLGRVR